MEARARTNESVSCLDEAEANQTEEEEAGRTFDENVSWRESRFVCE